MAVFTKALRDSFNYSNNYLFIDTETNGLPKNWKGDVTDLDNWPRMIQFAYRQHDREGKLISSGSFIIKPVGFVIDEQFSNIHGITNTRAMIQGISLKTILSLIKELIDNSSVIIGHNLSFDENIIGAELLRAGIGYSLQNKTKICTMESTVDLCCIETELGYKYPKLSELYYFLFNKELKDAHNAAIDVSATAKCFWELKRRGLI